MSTHALLNLLTSLEKVVRLAEHFIAFLHRI